MDKDAVLAFAKKNVVSLICAGVAVLAIGATFYPLGGMQDTLQTQADEKAKLHDTLNAFMKDRKRPVNTLDSTDYGKLDNLPNAATIKMGKEAVQAWKEYSVKTVAELVDLNKASHPLMQPDELPAFRSDTNGYQFPKLYLAILSVDPTTTSKGASDDKPLPENKLLHDNGDLNLQNEILHGGKPPSTIDEQAAEDKLWADKYEVRIIEQNGKRINELDLRAEYALEKKDLPLRLIQQMAKKYKCYVDPTAFPLATAIDPKLIPQPDDVWYCQTQIWVDRDLCLAIQDMNSPSTDVRTSPVKRVLSMNVDYNHMYLMKPLATGTAGQPAPPPPPVVPGAGPDSTLLVPDYTASPSGRYCNPLYDVVQFTLCVDVDASKVNQFIENLSKNNFVTITSESEFVVDTQTEFGKGFLYGNVPVVRLQLSGESLFFRGWTAPGSAPNQAGISTDLMPEKVKMQLGIITPTAGGAPGMGGMNNGRMPPPGMPQGNGGRGGLSTPSYQQPH